MCQSPTLFGSLAFWNLPPTRTQAPTSIGGRASGRVAGIASVEVGGVGAGGGVAATAGGGAAAGGGGSGGGASAGGAAGGGASAGAAWAQAAPVAVVSVRTAATNRL